MNRVLKSYKRIENKRFELSKLKGQILKLGNSKFDEFKGNILYKKYQKAQEDLETMEFIESVSDKANEQELKEYKEDMHDKNLQKLEAIDNKVNKMNSKISKLEYNREEYLHQLEHLRKEELKFKFAVEISETENNMVAKEKFEKDLENTRKQIESTDLKLNVTIARIAINKLRKIEINENSVKKIKEIEMKNGFNDITASFVASIKDEQYKQQDLTRKAIQQNEYNIKEQPKEELDDAKREKLEKESNERFNEKIDNNVAAKTAVYGTAGAIATTRTVRQALVKFGSKIKNGIQEAIKNIKLKFEHRNQKLLMSGQENSKIEDNNAIELKEKNSFVEKIQIDEKKAINNIKISKDDYSKENDDRDVG